LVDFVADSVLLVPVVSVFAAALSVFENLSVFAGNASISVPVAVIFADAL
jgi:hypothetical protein